MSLEQIWWSRFRNFPFCISFFCNGPVVLGVPLKYVNQVIYCKADEPQIYDFTRSDMLNFFSETVVLGKQDHSRSLFKIKLDFKGTYPGFCSWYLGCCWSIPPPWLPTNDMALC
jgi:hypothetical protein